MLWHHFYHKLLFLWQMFCHSGDDLICGWCYGTVVDGTTLVMTDVVIFKKSLSKMVQSIENDNNISCNQCSSIYHSSITSATNKIITTVTKHLSQKQQFVVKWCHNIWHNTKKFQKIGNNICHPKNLAIWQNYIQTTTKSNNIMNIFLQTPSKPSVLLRKTFSHTPDESRLVG